MYVRDAMLTEPVTSRPTEPFLEFLHRVVDSRQATAAVLSDENRLLGLVGIHDVLRKVVPVYVDLDTKLMEVMHEGYFEERLSRLEGLTVADLMCTEIDSISPDDTLIKTAALMVENRRKTLPVLQDGKFVGMITRRSLLERVVGKALT